MRGNQFLQVHGARKTARAAISNRIKSLLNGMTIDDLPDTSEMCDLVDSLEEIVEQYSDIETGEGFAKIKQFLDDEITMDLLERTVME